LRKGSVSQWCRALAGEAVTGNGKAIGGAKDGHGDLVRLEKIARQGLDFFSGHAVDGGEDFVEGREPMEIEFLASQIGHAGTGGFEGKHQRALQMILGAQQFFIGNRRFFHGAELGDGHIENLADGLLRRARIHAEHTGIGVRGEFAKDGISEAVFFADVLEETRRHAAAEKIIEDGHAKAALVSDGKRGDTDAEVDLLEIAFGFEADGRAGRRGSISIGMRGDRKMTEFLLDQLQDLVVGDIASGGDEEAIGGKPAAEALAKAFAVELADGFGSTENGAAEGMVGPEATGEDVVEKVFGVVEIHLDLFEDNLALFLHIVGIEFGAKDEISEHIKGDREMLIEDLGVEADLFFRGEGIEHATDGIHFAGNVFGRAALGALENHVFQEVSDAVVGGSFAAGTVADPDADGDGTDVLHGLRDHNEAVG